MLQIVYDSRNALLIEDQWHFIVVEEEYHRVQDEEGRGEKRESTILPVVSVLVRVEGKVVEVEEPEETNWKRL